ncbi:methyltransferase domain-containing protein [Spongiactinospora sp. TRM90649]|uniref:class I SAM-dependent methyltransferase n=1 Tax=Spongiactinospora sp. TRM90649 TaxID=3031114 RepID=UPI0023FA37D7|nr:methyltransferase domain-containing protein [Spongiactinospora sp. TRM90649]MDF5754427.1 methyltransferase domain-containing protein [Spongiactinospora sp. TRM90649]
MTDLTSRVASLDARWRAALAAWAIPEDILAAAPVDPWGLQVSRFARRTEALLAEPGGVTYETVCEALPEGGTLLDVGAGTGAASLPAATARDARLIAVDENPGMLADLRERAPEVATVEGRWPDVAERTPAADVVMSAHVVFNVPDLAAFLSELTAHAHHRVVVELPERHPTSWTAPLWLHFHGVTRPTGPVADDVAELARALGQTVTSRTHLAPDGGYASVDEMAAGVCRRLCLDPARAGEVARAAEELGVWPRARPTWFTLSWDVC